MTETTQADEGTDLHLMLWKLTNHELETALRENENVRVKLVMWAFEAVFYGLSHIIDEVVTAEGVTKRRLQVEVMPLEHYKRGVIAACFNMLGSISEGLGDYLTPEKIQQRLESGYLDKVLHQMVENKIKDPDCDVIEEGVVGTLVADFLQIYLDEDGNLVEGGKVVERGR